MLQDGGSGYRTYIFEECIRHYAVDRKGRGCKEVIYLRVANISCTRGVRESTGLSYRDPCGGVPWQLEEEAILKYYNSFLTQYKRIKKINNTIAEPNAERFILISINNALYTLYRGYMTKLKEINDI